MHPWIKIHLYNKQKYTHRKASSFEHIHYHNNETHGDDDTQNECVPPLADIDLLHEGVHTREHVTHVHDTSCQTLKRLPLRAQVLLRVQRDLDDLVSVSLRGTEVFVLLQVEIRASAQPRFVVGDVALHGAEQLLAVLRRFYVGLVIVFFI